MPPVKERPPPPTVGADADPKHLRAYRFHGLSLDHRLGRDDAHAESCPFCDAGAGKFGVKVATGEWKCFVCSKSGNVPTFLRELWRVSFARTNGHTKVLAADRKLLYPDTLHHWGVCKSVTTGDWLVPGYSPDGKLNNLYRYVKTKGSMKLLGTPELGHRVFGVPLLDPRATDVLVCEGPWDAMAAWEVARSAKRNSDGSLAMTGSPEASLLGAELGVLAVPGCSHFNDQWCKLLAGRRVHLMYDNDHPSGNQEPTPPNVGAAGYDGMVRAARVFARVDDRPAEVYYLDWGQGNGRGYEPGLSSGFDVRDFLTAEASDVHARITNLSRLMNLCKPIPADWVPGRTSAQSRRGGVAPDPVPCTDWKDLLTECRKAVKMTEGMEYGFACMLACVLSTRMTGPQLWLQVISPPSTGKTLLSEMLSADPDNVKSIGNFTGFHSGWKTDAGGETDHSLLAIIKNKTLIVKDGDTILKSKNRESILGEARDAYDTNCAAHYRNAINRQYVNHRFTFIILGTEAMLELDAAELGARFINVIIMRDIPGDLETEINRKKFFEIVRNRGVEVTEDASTQDDPEILHTRRVTAGFVRHLRANAAELLSGVDDSNADELCGRFDSASQFVAYMRARPAKRQDEVVVREMSARINGQLTKLALCLTVVLGKRRIDEDVLRWVFRAARDTCRGKTLTVVEKLFPAGATGYDRDSLVNLVGSDGDKCVVLLKFLKNIGVVEHFTPPSKGVRLKPRWRLTERVRKLYGEVVK